MPRASQPRSSRSTSAHRCQSTAENNPRRKRHHVTSPLSPDTERGEACSDFTLRQREAFLLCDVDADAPTGRVHGLGIGGEDNRKFSCSSCILYPIFLIPSAICCMLHFSLLPSTLESCFFNHLFHFCPRASSHIVSLLSFFFQLSPFLSTTGSCCNKPINWSNTAWLQVVWGEGG